MNEDSSSKPQKDESVEPYGSLKRYEARNEESEDNGIDESINEDVPNEQQENKEESNEQKDDVVEWNGVLKAVGKWLKRLVILGILFSILFGALLVVHICREFNSSNPFQLFLLNPPVTVSVRHGILSDGVVTVRNDSDKLLIVRVVLYKGQQGKYSLNVAKSGLTQIKPGETKEFGKLELEHSWGPTSGDKGFVCVEGYMRVVTFELYNGRYSHGYGFGIPDDAPMLIQVGGLQGLWRRD